MALTDNLILSLPFNGDWLDKSGNGNDVTPAGIILKSDTPKIGSGYAFGDGINDFGTIADSPSLDASFVTTACWIKYTSAGVMVVVERGTGGFGADEWNIFVNAGKIVAALNKGGVKLATSPLSYNNDAYHLGIMMYDGTALRLFVDNVYVAQNVVAGTIAASSDPITIFARAGSVLNFTTAMDSLLVWGRALSYGGVSIGQQATGEVAEVWNGGAGIEIEIDGNIVVLRRRMEEY